MSTEPRHLYPRRPGRLRWLLERLVLLVVAVLVLETWYLEGLTSPCRVVSNSMAEALLGPHREVTCGDCGCRLACGIEPGAAAQRAVCPNCGYAGNDLRTQPELPGDGVLIFKSAFAFRPPRRWEVVAFRRPDRAGEILIKRVVGLPGEAVQIREGDVYVDGHIQCKNLAQQRAMATLVHDADMEPTLGPTLPPRWQGAGRHSRWGSAHGRFAHPATPDDQTVDWLEYRHWCREPGKEGQVRVCPITDLGGYNQSQPRRSEDLHPVPDVMLSLRLVEAWGAGSLSVSATDGLDQFYVLVHTDPDRCEVQQNGRPIGRPIRLPGSTSGMNLEVSLFDRQLLVAFDGRVVVQYAYLPTEGRDREPSWRPLAIGVRGLGVVIRDLRVYRDVYYSHPVGVAGRWGLDKPVKLGDNEFFVLGDNSPVSEDSRTWPEGPAVNGELLVGEPLLVHFPAQRIVLGRRVFQVPDLARIRYIR